MHEEPYFSLASYGYLDNWGGAFFGRAGIAYANTKNVRGVAALTGADAAMLTDGDLKALLGGKLLLDGAGARALTERGFAASIGCRAEDWSGPVASFEVMKDGFRLNRKPAAVKLTAIDPKAEELSEYRHREAALSEESVRVGAGAIRYRNAAGGEVIVLADSLPKRVNLSAFHFYTESRKRQVLGYLRDLGYDAPYYPGDAEVLLKWGRAKDGTRILAALDTGHDDLEELPLVLPAAAAAPVSVERLQPDGTWQAVRFEKTADRLVLGTPVRFLEPLVTRWAF